MTPAYSLKLLLLPGVLACVLTSSCNAQKSRSVEEHFSLAQQDQQQGLFDAAAHEYETVLRLQPGIPEAYVNLGLVYYAQSKFDESARALATAGKLRPGMRGVSLWLGIDYVKLRRPAQAVALLREAVRLDPSDKQSQSWLGTALWDAGQMDAALLQLRKAAALFPDDPDLLFALGEAYGKAASQQMQQLLDESSGTALSDRIYGTSYAGNREWIKAEGHLRRAIERDPKLLDARLELAETFLQQARLPVAQEQLEQAVALAPRSASALARSGELFLLMQQRAEGLSRIETAIEIDPSEALDALRLPAEDRIVRNEEENKLLSLSGEAAAALEADTTSSPARNVALAALYELAGDNDASLRAYREITLAPTRLNLSANLVTQARTVIHQHRYENAEPLLLRWLAANPGDRNARYDLILVRRQISMAQIVRLLAIAPDSYHVHQLLGQFYVSLTTANEASGGVEEDDKAIAEYLAVAAARPDLPDVHFWLGHLYWKHGDADHALPQLKRELEISPDHPEANGELGAMLVAQGNTTEAIPHLLSAVHSMPDLWPAYLQLAQAYAAEKNFTRAEEMLKHALAHDQDGSMHYQLGLILRAQGKTAQAAQAFDQVRAIKKEKMTPASSDDSTIGVTTK